MKAKPCAVQLPKKKKPEKKTGSVKNILVLLLNLEKIITKLENKIK